MKYQNKTKQEWFQYLEDLKIKDVLPLLVTRLVGEGAQYTVGNEGDGYEALKMINKPTRKQFREELDSYIAEEKVKIEAIFQSMENKKVFFDRIDAIKEYLPVIIWELDKNKEVSNINEFIQNLKLSMDLSKLEALEAKVDSAKSFKSVKELKDKRSNLVHNASKKCANALNAFYGYRLDLNLSEDNNFNSYFADAVSALKDFNPTKAKKILEGLTSNQNVVQLVNEMLLELG